MMKTTLTGCFLGMTMMAGLLMAPFAIAQNEDQPEVLMQAVQQRDSWRDLTRSPKPLLYLLHLLNRQALAVATQ